MSHVVPPGAEERMIQLPEGRVRVLVGGEAGSPETPALLIHGGGSDNSGISWFHSFNTLGADRRVIAIDLPGFGGTTEIPPVGGPEPMADFIVRVANQLKVQKAVIIGVSMGGDVAMNVVLKAIVKDPDALPPEVVEEFVRESRIPGAGIAYLRYNQATIGRRGLLNNLLPRLHEIEVPTLLFHGEDDPMVNPKDSQRAAELIPNARLVLVPDTGHWAQLEAPELFGEEARRFLAGLDAAERP